MRFNHNSSSCTADSIILRRHGLGHEFTIAGRLISHPRGHKGRLADSAGMLCDTEGAFSSTLRKKAFPNLPAPFTMSGVIPKMEPNAMGGR